MTSPPSCQYDGLQIGGCPVPGTTVGGGSFGGNGIAGPLFPLPTTVAVCPGDEEQGGGPAIAYNEGVIGLSSTGEDPFGCAELGIQYQSSAVPEEMTEFVTCVTSPSDAPVISCL